MNKHPIGGTKPLNNHKQLLKIMRISLFLLFFSVLVSQSANTFSQETKLSINLKSSTIKDVCKEIEKISSYSFVFSGNANKLATKQVDINANAQNIEQILDNLLAGTRLAYRILEKQVVVYERGEKEVDKIENTNLRVQQEKKKISGKVVDIEGNAIAGANIVEMSMMNGTISDKSGEFILYVNKNSTIRVSFVGYLDYNFTIDTVSEIVVVLREDAQSLDDLVITGYQTLSKSDIVGSVSKINMKDILTMNHMTVDKMLQGIVPGMIVTNNSSRVGSSPSIQIRGTSTLLGNSSPLWVVDGIIQEDPIEVNPNSALSSNLKEIIGNQVSWLNPLDIETITVLKDASATAIYGSKASNGVILITTKKAEANDRVRINYRGASTINTRPNYGMFNVMNSQERIQFSDEVFASGVPYDAVPYLDPNVYEGMKRLFIEGYINQDQYNQKRRRLETVNTDWFDILTRTGFDQNHSLSFTSGSERMNISSSVSFSDQQGQEIGNDGQKYTGRVATGLKLSPKVSLNMSLLGAYNKTSSFGTNVNPMNYAIRTSRAIPAFDEIGNLAYYQINNGYNYNKNEPSLDYNILNERDNSGSSIENMHVAINSDLKWHIKSWLSYNFTAGFNYNTSAMETNMGEKTYHVANAYRGYNVGSAEPGSENSKAAILPFGGEFYTENAHQKTYNIQNKINVNLNFADESRLNILLGQEIRSGTNISTANTVWGYSKERGETIMKPTLPNDLVPTASALFTYTGYGVFDQLYNGRWKRNNQTNNFMSLFATAVYSNSSLNFHLSV